MSVLNGILNLISPNYQELKILGQISCLDCFENPFTFQYSMLCQFSFKKVPLDSEKDGNQYAKIQLSPVQVSKYDNNN